MAKGIIYVMTTVVPGLIKIGKTGTDNFENRMYQLERNGYFNVVGLKREDVYIANIVKCRPPSNRNPEDEEAAACLNYLRNQVILVKPKIIVLLGSIALKNILGKEYGITASRGKWVEKKGILYLPTWHPAALLRDESKKIDFWNDLKKLKWKIFNPRGASVRLEAYQTSPDWYVASSDTTSKNDRSCG